MERFIKNSISKLHDNFGYGVFELSSENGLSSRWVAALSEPSGVEVVLFSKIEDLNLVNKAEIKNELYHILKTSDIKIVLVILTANDYYEPIPIEENKIILNYKDSKVLSYSNGCENTAQRIYSILSYSERKNSEVKYIPKVTYAIIAINILYFLVSAVLSGSLFDININVLVFLGAKYNHGIQNGQLYRLVTCMFLHGGFVHIALNMYALYAIGPLVEKIFGRWKFLIIYFVSGIVSSLLSFLLSDSISVGASGAIFGLLGACLVFALKNKNKIGKSFLSNIVSVIFINVIIGLSMPNIDNFGHFGGLIGGITASSILYTKIDK